MKTFKPQFKLDKATDATSGGAGGSDDKTKQDQSQTSKDEKKPEQTGNSIEDRYKKTSSNDEKQQSAKTDDKKDEKKAEDESSTGYGDDLEDVDAGGYSTKEKPTDEKKEEKKDDSSAEDYESLDMTELDEDLAKDVKEFVKQNKLPKETAQALVNREKSNIKALNEAIDKVTQKFKDTIATDKRTRAQRYQQELKNDKEFGGENFKHNLKKVDNFLTEFLPNVKNDLTKNKGILPPSAMRDILKLSQLLKSNDKRVDGDQVSDDNVSSIEKRYANTNK